MLFSFSYTPTYDFLSGSYGGISRVTPYQADVATWIQENIPEQDDIYGIGPAGGYGKKKWIRVLSQHFIGWMIQDGVGDMKINLSQYEYVMIDRSDLRLLQQNPPSSEWATNQLGALSQFESEIANRSINVYTSEFIRVYKLE